MTPSEFEQFLHQEIPLTAAMQVTVISMGDDGVVLQAPLAPNINPHGTVFGGSASTLAILAAWCAVHVKLRTAGIVASEVIQSNTMEYLRPITGTFTARASLKNPDEWEPFVRMLSRRGKGRVEAMVLLEQEGELVGRLHGQLVALRENH